MRYIRFRGKRLNDGEWVYGGIATSREGKTWIMADSDLAYRTELVDPATVGQYTGRKDKNGKDIYKGDVIAISMINDTSTYEVYWDSQICGFLPFINTSKDSYVCSEDIEVIGNIYEKY